MKPCSRTFSFFLLMDCQSLQNRVLAFVLRKVKQTKAQEMRLRLLGAGWLGREVGAKEEKSETSRRKSQPLPGIPKVPKEKEQKKLDFLLCEQFTVHPIRASHLALGKGYGWGCLLGLLGAKTLGAGPRHSPGRRSSWLHQITFVHSRLPTARCLSYLAPPPAFVPPAPPPAC